VGTSLTSSAFWISAAGAALLGVPLTLACLALFRSGRFARSPLEIAVAAAIFWGMLAIALTASMWNSYYTHFAPDWQRRLAPLSAILYAGLALLLWWLARRSTKSPALVFLMLGGLESLVEHGAAIWGGGLLTKVPMLAGVTAAPMLVFAFFEYVLYWGLTLLLARLLARPLSALRKSIAHRTPS
jgi:hypothetical protein